MFICFLRIAKEESIANSASLGAEPMSGFVLMDQLLFQLMRYLGI